MRRICFALLMALCLASPIKAWGGLFNRFNPSLMSDVYGGGSYGKQLYSVAEGGKVRSGALGAASGGGAGPEGQQLNAVGVNA